MARKSQCPPPLADFEAASVELFQRLVAERLLCRLTVLSTRHGSNDGRLEMASGAVSDRGAGQAGGALVRTVWRIQKA